MNFSFILFTNKMAFAMSPYQLTFYMTANKHFNKPEFTLNKA